MPEKSERPRGRVRARILLLAGGATAVIAVAIALGGAGTVAPSGQQDSMDTPHDVTGDDVSTSSRPWRKSTVSSTSPTPVSLALSHRRTGERDGGSGKQVGPIRNRVHINEPHRRHELLRPRPLAAPAPDRPAPRSSPRPKRALRDPHPQSPTASGRGENPSLIDMKCNELFPPHKHDFRLRNIACHRLLG
jgi:hypothetical protein